MKLEIQDNNKSHYVFIRDGIAGNKQTVFQMVHLVQNTVNYDKGFNDFVNKFAISQGFTAYTENYQPETVIKSVYDFVKNNIAYLSDKAGKIESIKSVVCSLLLLLLKTTFIIFSDWLVIRYEYIPFASLVITVPGHTPAKAVDVFSHTYAATVVYVAGALKCILIGCSEVI